MSSIPISQLNILSIVTSDDYIPVVDNSTTTTYRLTFSSISNWISSSTMASSSFSSISASKSISSSWSDRSGLAINANNLIYPNISTASLALNAITASNALTASLARTASFATSASWAPSIATTTVPSASWASESLHSVSSSWAPVPISASWASSSLSSSFLRGIASGSNVGVGDVSFFGTASAAQTASFALNVPPSANYIKAFASFIVKANFTDTPPNNTVTILGSYNISSIVINYGKIDTWNGNNNYYFTVTFTTPMTNNNYFTIGSGGERGGSIETYIVSAPPNYTGNQSDTITIPFKTTSSFVFQLDAQGADRTSGENAFAQFVVFGT